VIVIGLNEDADKVRKTKRTPLRFTVRTLLAVVTLVAVCLGGWISYENHKIHNLEKLRQQGAIVIVRDGTPQWLRSLGIERLVPFYSVPTVELYVTPKGNDAIVGNSGTLTSKSVAQKLILDQASTARANGANDIQLIIVDDFDREWSKFASDNSLASIGESKQRYAAWLKANLESGANINP